MLVGSRLKPLLDLAQPLERRRWSFFDHFVTRRWLTLSPKGPANSFSAHFGGSGWATQLAHYSPQPPPDLLRAWRAVLILPRSPHFYSQPFCQMHLIMNQANQARPQFKVGRFTQPGLGPQQILFVEAKAVFNRITPFVKRPNLLQGYL